MPDNEPNQNPPKPAEDNNPPTSADLAGSKTAGILKKLETRISFLEDTNKGLKEQNAALEAKVGTLAKLPSQVTKGKSLLDDLDEFVFGSKPNPPVVPPNPASNT